MNPSAAEVCNDRDDDCDGTVNEGAVDTQTWYTDQDSDGYGDPATAGDRCQQPNDVNNGNDCNDDDSSINPSAEDTPGDDIDQDCTSGPNDADGDGHSVEEGDCDDADASIHPGAADIAGDDIDQDCSGTPWDVDDDGSGVEDGDCDDHDGLIHPGAVDVAGDEIDQDCSGLPYDIDGDGVGVEEGDCDDADPTVNPDIPDVPGNDIDENCDGGISTAINVYGGSSCAVSGSGGSMGWMGSLVGLLLLRRRARNAV